MESYVIYARSLLAQGLTTQAIISDLRSHQLTDDIITQVLQSIASPLNPPVEAYVDYVKMQASRGMALDTIANDLRMRGMNQDSINALLRYAAQTQPASYPQAMQQYSAQETTAVPQESTAAEPQRLQNSRFGWVLIVLGCLIPSIFIMLDQKGRFASGAQILLTLGDITGVIGLCLYAFDLILAMRLSWIEDIFGGLNKVYVAHAILGSTALMFVLIHPVLLSIRLLPDGLKAAGSLFIPSLHYIGTAYGILATIAMLGLLFITLYIHLPYKLWLVTHKYLGATFLLVGLHVLFSPNSITDNIFVHAYLLILVFLGLAAFVYRTLLPDIFIRRYIYMIKEVKMKTTGVVEITLMPEQKPIQFVAGQFLFISFQADGVSNEWHPFTISSAPSNGSISITVKSLGAYTETIYRLVPNMVGMSVKLEGAYGRFSFRNFKNLNQVWIAGGIGITPFLSMAQNLGDGPYTIDLYYSVKSEAELIDADELARAQVNAPGKVFRVFPFVTDKYNRRLTADLIEQNSGGVKGKDFLICGPPPMMHGLEKQLLDMGVKKYRIHSEEFSIT